MRHVPISVAMAMPLTGLDEEPSSPVMREDTTEKKKPNTTMMAAESSATPKPGTACSCGRNAMKSARPSEPKITSRNGRSRSVRRVAAPASAAQVQVAEGGAERVQDRGQRLQQVDDPAGGHRAGADVADVARPDVVGQHLVDGDGGRVQRQRPSLAEQRDGRDQDQPGQQAAADHDGRRPVADDVADAHQLGRDVHGHLRGLAVPAGASRVRRSTAGGPRCPACRARPPAGP